jgi:hypothetical protein
VNITSRAATDYIDFVCPHADCGFHVSVPNVTDIYVCPNCETLVLVTAQRAIAAAAPAAG